MPAAEYMTLDHAQDVEESSDYEDLSTEQIDELLKRAEQRLKNAEDLTAAASSISNHARLPRIQARSLPKPYVRSNRNVARAEQKSLVDEKQRKLAEKPKVISDPVAEKEKKKEKARTLTAWHDLPRTKLTPELKRDLQLLHLRSVLDPKRMYKKQGKLKIPEYSQVGTLVEGPTEFFSARINLRDRKRTLLEETLSMEAQSGRVKRKYVEIQAHQKSGKMGWYRAMRAKRKAGLVRR